MAILAGDIKLVASRVMDDVPEGGGAPTPIVILDGQSNAIFPDISELDRAGGRVNMRKLHISVQTQDTDTYMGCNIIVADPPEDPNVSVTLFSTGETFDERLEAVNRIESYLTRGPLWPAALFENHVAGQRSIQLLQRPDTPMPAVGRTLFLIFNEGLPSEKIQPVRVTRAESEIRQFHDVSSDSDFPGMITTLRLSDKLKHDFPGSAATKSFSAQSGKTVVRDTTVADAASYYGVAPLATAATIGQTSVQASSIYTQLVPSARTEAIALDQKPSAQRSFTLAAAPRLVEVGLTPHSMRIRVGQENRGYSWVQMLRPRPAPNTVVVSYRVQGSWYTMQDDGQGSFTGSGVGVVNYATGSISLTFPSLPDSESSIVFSWGENTAYTSRAGTAGFRPPEFAYALPHQGIKPGSVQVTWLSGGVEKSLTDNGKGVLVGDGTGQINYASGKLFVCPSHMIDAGGEFNSAYTYATLITQNVAAPAIDAGGFANIVLDQVPFPKSVTVKWITVRNVSATSGSSEINKTASSGQEAVTMFQPSVRALGLVASATSVLGGGTVKFTYSAPEPAPVGTYTFTLNTSGLGAYSFLSGSVTGSFAVAATGKGTVEGFVDIALAPDAQDGTFFMTLYSPNLTLLSASNTVNVTQFPAALTSIPSNMPQAGIKVRTPLGSGLQTHNGKTDTLVAGMYAGGRKLNEYSGYYELLHVGVYPSESALYGFYYDPPADPDQVWSPAELAASVKSMLSLNGVIRDYPLWAGPAMNIGAAYQYTSA